MELRQIRYFTAVAETKSLTMAVKRLHIAQPALSQNIKNLEEDLGARLFVRSRQGMELTEKGKIFLEHSYAILQQVERARDSIHGDEEDPQGTVSIGMPASIANVLTVPLYTHLNEHCPKIELLLEERILGELKQAFEAGLYDLILAFDAGKSDDVVAEDLLREDLYLTLPWNSKLKKRSEIKFRELGNYLLYAPKIQQSMRETLEKHALAENVQLNLKQLPFGMHPTLKMIEAGLGNSVMPWSAIYELTAKNSVTALRITHPPVQRTVSMLTLKNRPSSVAVSRVMEAVRIATRQVHSEDKWRGGLLSGT